MAVSGSRVQAQPLHKVSQFKRTVLYAAMLSSAATVNAANAESQEAAQSQQVQSKQTFDIAAGPLASALVQFSSLTGLTVSYTPEVVNTLTSKGLVGSYLSADALTQLLQGTGLQAKAQRNGSYTIIKAKKKAEAVETLETVHVAAAAEGFFGDSPVEPDGFKAEYQTTATKMAMSLKETPQAISVVTRDSLDARQVQDIQTGIELTAGVGIGTGVSQGPGPFSGRGQYGQSYSLRGQSLGYGRGLRSDGFSMGNLSQLDLAAFERVEVVKGPSGFYGQGSLGGYINLVRKKPQKEFEASVSVQAGSYDTYRTEVDVTGALTDSEHIRGRLTAAYGDAGSFVDRVNSDITMIAPSVEIVINDNTRALLQVLYQEENFITNNGVSMHLEGNKYKTYNTPRSFLFGAAGDDSDTQIIDTTLKVDHELSDRWLASLLLQGNKSKRNIIISNQGYDYYGTPDVYVYGIKDNTKADRWAGELRLEGKFDAFEREHQVLFGVEENKSHDERAYGAVYLGTANIYAGNFSMLGTVSEDQIATTYTSSSKVRNSAVYGQTMLSLTERTKLLLSVRYDRAKQERTTVNRGRAAFSEKTSYALTTRIGLVQEFTDNITAYATYAESFNPVLSTGRSGILDPETGEGYELGLKTDWLNNRLGATVAIYRQELDNRPISDPTNGVGEFFNISAGLHRTEGVEFEVTGSPYPGLTVAGAATWMDNEFIDRNDPNYGLSVSGSVDRQFSVYANYEVQGGPLKYFGFGATLLSLGKRKFIHFSGTQAELDGYERVDLNFSYKGFPDWDMSLQVRNLFDKDYVERASGRAAFNTFYGSPRAALFKATYHF